MFEEWFCPFYPKMYLQIYEEKTKTTPFLTFLFRKMFIFAVQTEGD